MATPQEIKTKRVEAERMAKEALVKLEHAKELERNAVAAEVAVKQADVRKVQEELHKQQRELERVRRSAA